MTECRKEAPKTRKGISMLKRLCSLFAVTAVALLVLASPASAATITPNILTDELNAANANCSLREAVSIANTDATTAEPDCPITNGGLGDDTISLGANTYVLSLTGLVENSNNSGDLDVLSTGGDLTIDGAGAAQTTIGTVGAPTWDDRVLHQVAGAGVLVVSDLAVSGGNDTGGSGGGGILASLTTNGSLTVQGARITGNDSLGAGGGIDAGGGSASSSLSILDSVVDVNSAAGAAGGGGVLSNVPTTIDSSVISGNDATRPGPRGGGILVNGPGNAATITDSIVSGNTAESTDAGQPLGGGISAENGSGMTVARTTVSGNHVVGGSGSFGAGINVLGAATTATVVNSTISGNEALSAGGAGGGARTNGGTITIVQSTFGPNPVDPVSGFGSALVRSSGAINIRGSAVETLGRRHRLRARRGVHHVPGLQRLHRQQLPVHSGNGRRGERRSDARAPSGQRRS